MFYLPDRKMLRFLPFVELTGQFLNSIEFVQACQEKNDIYGIFLKAVRLS